MKESTQCEALRFSTLAIVFLLSMHISAQDTPIGAPGTQVGTEQTAAASTTTNALQKAVQNPVASLISVPIQNNNNFGTGPADRTQDVLNIQPVIPVPVSRTGSSSPASFSQSCGSRSGPPAIGGIRLGGHKSDIFPLTRQAQQINLGCRARIVIPTATDLILGQGKWSMGPSVVALIQPNKWTLGALVNNVWSIAGSRRPPCGQSDDPAVLCQLQPEERLIPIWYHRSSPPMGGDKRRRWTVPFGGGVGRIMKLGFQPVNISAAFYDNRIRPRALRPGACVCKFLSCSPS